MTRYPEECVNNRGQSRGNQDSRNRRKRQEIRKEEEDKIKKEKIIEIKKVAEEWVIWDKEEEPIKL